MISKEAIRQKAQEILESNFYLTIAVADDGTFYWYSSKETRHSKLITKNPRVALPIFDSTATGDDVDALYIQADAC